MLVLPILMYHRVEVMPPNTRDIGNYVAPEQFGQQLSALSQWGYTFITLDDWLAFRGGCRKPPRRAVALTFDDGYLSNYTVAWPILRRYGATATVFLVANAIGQSNHWDGASAPLLGPDQILAMQKCGVLFGSHTCTHRSLLGMKPTEAMIELTWSRTLLETMLGKRVVTLAYPYNQQNHAVRVLARQAGYRAAVVGRGRLNFPWTNPWALMRIPVNAQMSLTVLEGLLTKAWPTFGL